MARMFPDACPARKGETPVTAAERGLFERLARDLDAGWSVIHDCEVRAGGENGAIEFVLVHRMFGLALLGVAEPDEEADPDSAVAAMRAMLGEIGFFRRFPGRLAIAAATLPPRDETNLRATLERAFAALPASTIADPTWTEWLIMRLTGRAPAAAPPDRAAGMAAARGIHLRAPERDEAWRLAEEARSEAKAALQGVPAMNVTADPILASEDAISRPTNWVGMALALIVVSVVLLGMALLSHGNG
jgi:hypothetical protein